MLRGTSSGLKPATDWRKEKHCKHNRDVKDSSIRGAFLFNRIKMFQRAFLPLGFLVAKLNPVSSLRAEVASDKGFVRGNCLEFVPKVLSMRGVWRYSIFM